VRYAKDMLYMRKEMAVNDEIRKISALLERISSDVYGNGREGMIKSMARMEEKINNLAGSVTYHTKVISNFIEYQATHNGEEKGKKELEARQFIARELEATKRRDKTQRIFIYSMIILTAIGLFFAGRGLFNKIGTVETTVKDEIRAQEGISKVTRGGYVKYNDRGLSDSIKIK